ncbi:MAG: ABC transporter ATP-binding protein [Bryobacterales bacterium]|nr:ABC transporter ATP-binding protein [Bryobacterales bacterium]
MSGEWRRALAYLAPYRGRLALVLLLTLTGTALSLAVPYLSRILVDEALLKRDARALAQVVAAFAAITVAGFVLNVASGLLYTRVSAGVLFDMRLAVYRHLQTLSPRFYARTRLGEIVSRLNSDLAEVQRVAAETALAWVGNVVFLAGTISVLAWMDWRLFLLAVMPAPFALWTLRRYRSTLAARVGELREHSAGIGSFLIETLRGVKLVATSNAQERERQRFSELNDGFVGSLLRMQRASYFSGGLPGLILSLGTAAVFLYGGQRVMQGELTLGTLVAFLAYQMRLLAPVQALMGLAAGLATARVSLGRVEQLLQEKPEVIECADPVVLGEARGEIALEAVSFAFDREPLLAQASCRVRPGEMVAIVGASGSGKSTIADLLVRLLDPDAGRVCLDGQDIRTLRLEDLRRTVALVDQEPFFFHTTVAANLRYAAPEATEEDVEAAVEAAGIAEKVRSWPRGFQTVVGEEGTALSTGERQRLALARALLAKPRVLVLDEPTASVDPAAERQMLRALRGRTVVVITHRHEVARQADRVLRLEAGRLVEEPEVARYFAG